MAKTDKNNQLSRNTVYGTPTLTAEELKAGANKLGGWFLRGMGAVGKFLNAGFTSPTYGTNGQVSYARNTLDAKRLRELSEALEQALAKGSTYIMPANYIVGKGNPVKGEEKISLMEPWLLATIRGAELYFGPKAIKGVKNVPKTVVNTAAKAGSKTAKKAVVAKELNKGIKENIKNGKIEVGPEYFNAEDRWYRMTELPEKIGIEEQGRNITTLDALSTQGTINGWRESILENRGNSLRGKHIFPIVDGGWLLKLKISLSKHGLAHGNTSLAAKGKLWEGTLAHSGKFPFGIIEGLAPVKIHRGMTSEGLDSRTNFILLDWGNVPIGKRIGFHTGEMPMENLGWFQELSNGKYTYEPIIPEKRITYHPTLLLEPSTSLAFFERRPSKISLAERLGISKGDRGNLSLNLKQAIEDLALYKNSGLYRLNFIVDSENNPGWGTWNNKWFLKALSEEGPVTQRGPWIRTGYLSNSGIGIVSFAPEFNLATYSTRMFPIPEGLNWAPGEANMLIEGPNHKVILTAPKTDFFDGMGVVDDVKDIGKNLSSTIDKNIMKDFWINSRKMQRPGSYMSGDNGVAPLGSTLIEAFKKKLLHKTPVLERSINLLVIRRTGLSPDSYSSIIRLGNRDGSLRWGEGFTKWNNSAITNKNIYDAYQLLMKGEITPEQYEGIFNKWSLEIGGRPLQWTTIGELKIPVHPHPYIYAKKQGGKMNVLEFLKKGSGIHIKKENRGKFTDYCGGKVTSACIAKGKSSSNPTIRKRATFAANARKWKHKKGGILLFLLQGNKIDWAGIIGNFASQALLTYALNKLILAQADLLKEANNALKVSPMEYVSKYFLEIMDEENRRNEAMKAITGTTINSSDIVGKFFAHQRGKLEAFAHNKEIDNLNKMIDAEAKGLKSQGWMNLFSNGLLTGIGMLASNIGKSNNNVPPSSTITTTSYILPKLTTNTWTPNTTLNTTLGLYSTPLTDSNKFWNK